MAFYRGQNAKELMNELAPMRANECAGGKGIAGEMTRQLEGEIDRAGRESTTNCELESARA